jgi:hypothetical protein
MIRRFRGNGGLALLLTATAAVLCLPSGSRAQSDPFHSTVGSFGGEDTKTEYGRGDGVFVDKPPDPYKGQIYCPVTGNKLGTNGPAQEVQTSMGEQKPTGFRKMMGAKPTPGVVMYTCCPECAKKVKANPSLYYVEIVADRAVFTFHYDAAPEHRPERPKGKPYVDPLPIAEPPASARSSVRPLSGESTAAPEH